jgi:hypothetical protein
MGTTESIFLDPEEGEDHSRHRSSLPTASLDNSVPQTGQRRRVHVGSSTAHRLSTGATSVPNELAGHPRRPPPSPNRPYSSPLSQHAAEKEHVRRHNVKPSQDDPYAPSCFQLDGMIVGKAKSGKRTLLQRLEGKEPQFSISRTTPRRRNGDMESIKSDDVDSLETVTAPYQAPVNLPTFDAMIQLQVSASTKAVRKTGTHDFYVVLIDPRHDRSKIQKFLTKTLQSVLRAQGYQSAMENTNDTSAESVVTRRPFCLCLLRNFGDLVLDAHNNTASTNGGSEREISTDSDLTTWTMDVLSNYTLDESLMQLQCATVSLYNCYGLGVLHHFIYQAYLHRKRYDANVQLRHMNEALTQSKRDAPATVSYQQYLEDMEQLLQNQSVTASNRPNPVGSAAQSVESSSTSIRGDDDETATTATSSGVAATASSRRQIIAPPRSSHPQQQQRDNVSPLRTNTNANPRQAASASWGDSSSQPTLASLQQQPNDHAKEMLEAFLESDSSDDGNEYVNDINEEVEDSTKDDTETTSTAASPPSAKPPLHSVIMTASADGESESHATPKAKDRRVVRPLSLRRFDSDDESDDDFYVNDIVAEQLQHIDKETAPQLDDTVTAHTKQDAGQESKSDDAGTTEPERQSLPEQVVVEREGDGGSEAHVNDTACRHHLDANDVDLSNGKKPVDDADCKVSTAPLDGASPADDAVDQDRDANDKGAVAMAAASQNASSPLSEAARAAIAAAQEDFERMLEQTERDLKSKKSKKSDGKKKSKKDKKASADE